MRLQVLQFYLGYDIIFTIEILRTVQKEKIQMSKERQNTNVSDQKVSAKAMGLKTVVVMDDSLAISSFADKAVAGATFTEKSSTVEKITTLQGVVKEDNSKLLEAEVSARDITIKPKAGRDAFADVEVNPINMANPGLRKDIGSDAVGIRPIIENIIFGKEFPKDNLHVQIAYNILDIKKILNAYVNNIIYMFYNLSRSEQNLTPEQMSDLIGTLYSYSSAADAEKKYINANQASKLENLEKVKEMLKGASAYFTYFGNVFKSDKPCATESEKQSNFENNYTALRILSLVRQACVHGAITSEKSPLLNQAPQINGKKFALYDAGLFNLSLMLSNPNDAPLKEKLEDIYKNVEEKVKNDFTKNSGNNLYVLNQIYPNLTGNELAQKYYDYVIRKETRNIGVNLKTLREIMLKEFFPEASKDNDNVVKTGEDRYATFRSKIYVIFDFILMEYFNRNDSEKSYKSTRNRMIAELRRAQKDESKKAAVYRKYAAQCWTDVGVLWQNALRILNKQKQTKFTDKFVDYVFESLDTSEYRMSVAADLFVKLLYFICLFLDGKEINELMTAMINKFQNIADLIDIGAACHKPIKFSTLYIFFTNSRVIASHIKMAKNYASMQFSARQKGKASTVENYSEILYRDALALFGYTFAKYKSLPQDKNLYELSDEEKEMYYTDEYKHFRAILYEKHLPADSRRFSVTSNGELSNVDHKVRNFIANNILNSKWFFYVAKYNKLSKCRTLMANEDVLNFVLKDIPDDQIRRYYRAITADRASNVDIAFARSVVLKNLKELSGQSIFSQVDSWDEADYASQSASGSKEKLKALIRLYLTVAYLITKSMVKVNTRFTIAFAMAERDYFLHKLSSLEREKEDCAWLYLTKQALKKRKSAIGADAEEDSKAIEVDGEMKRFLQEHAGNSFTSEDKKEYVRLRRKLHADRHRKHICDYLQSNLESYAAIASEYKSANKNKELIVDYRNNVAHLNVINTMDRYIADCKESSYYGMYCYCLQRHMFDDICEKAPNGKISEIMKKVKETGTCSKDLMWLINLPFAYNLPRYKNLSNEILFNERDKGIPCVRDEKGEYKPLKDKKATDIIKAEF